MSNLDYSVRETYLTNNRCFKQGKTIVPKGFMLHSVGCPQPCAEVFVKNWNNSSSSVCVHGFIDAVTGEVYKTLPYTTKGWHCGAGKKGSANNTHIGFEMCEPSCIKYTSGSNFTCGNLALAKEQVTRTYQVAVKLCADICREYGLNPKVSGVVISHKEGYALGVASNHGDPEHLWVQLGLPFTMDTFRDDVYNLLHSNTTTDSSTNSPANTEQTDELYRVRKSWDDSKSQIGAYKNLNYAKDACNKNPGYIVFNSSGVVVYSSRSNSLEYVVQKGDTLTKIAETFNTNIHLLSALNKLKSPDEIYVGQLIHLPKVCIGAVDDEELTEVAKLVWQGVYGNGETRRKKLEAEGYNYSEVQKYVNAARTYLMGNR